ncbi:MAG: outer membrane beta-barrel protein [Bacteroidetes bacterium]|nr:outer membrane beta-barrel protein [Bacteroidota bacterium]
MKLHRNSLMAILILTASVLVIPMTGKSQIINEKTKKKIHVGLGLFTDIFMKVPSGVKTRTINQGFQGYVVYRVPFGKSNFGFGIGVGMSIHNLYGNFTVKSYTDSTNLVKIPDTIGYKRSKLTMPYLEIPIEFGYTNKSKFSLGIGFKVGYMLPAHTKYVGDDPDYPHEALRAKYRNVMNLDRFAYGPTLRIGYKWFHVTGYYQLSSIFQKGKGPEMYPISVGFLLRPF